MGFYTVINCIDGRVQIPVIRYIQDRFNVEYVDLITEPGPDLILSEQEDIAAVDSILNRVNISIEKHGSHGIAIAGHYDCAANPAPESEHVVQLNISVDFLKSRYPGMEIIGLWVDRTWKVREIV